jgi:putative transposase
MRVRAYLIQNHCELKTQLEVACKLYNTLLHAEQEEYERNKHSMNKTELRQLALDLRKKNKEF